MKLKTPALILIIGGPVIATSLSYFAKSILLGFSILFLGFTIQLCGLYLWDNSK